MALAAYKTLRPNVRADTYVRDGGRCRCCQRVLALNSDDPYKHANIHETEGPRWKTAIDVSLRVTITLCKTCHEDVEQHRIALTSRDEALGCNGAVAFTSTSLKRTTNLISLPAVEHHAFVAARAAGNAVHVHLETPDHD